MVSNFHAVFSMYCFDLINFSTVFKFLIVEDSCIFSTNGAFMHFFITHFSDETTLMDRKWFDSCHTFDNTMSPNLCCSVSRRFRCSSLSELPMKNTMRKPPDLNQDSSLNLNRVSCLKTPWSAFESIMTSSSGFFLNTSLLHTSEPNASKRLPIPCVMPKSVTNSAKQNS